MIACLTGLHIDWMLVALTCGVITSMWTLWRVQRAMNGVDFKYVILGDDGKPMWSKMAAIAGFVVGSWVLIYVTIAGKIPDGLVLLFLCYFAICIGSPMAFAIINAWKGAPPTPPQQTVTATGPATSTVTIQPGVQP